MSALSDLIEAEVGLQDYWPFDDGSGSSAFDFAGAPYGVYHGAPTFNAPGVPPLAGGGSVRLNTRAGDATGDYVQGGSSYSTTPSGTIELWFCPPESPADSVGNILATFYSYDLADEDGTKCGPTILADVASGVWHLYIRMPVYSLGLRVESGGSALAAPVANGAWNHVVLRWSPTLATLFLNGVERCHITESEWDDDALGFADGLHANFYVGGGVVGGGVFMFNLVGSLGSFSDVATYTAPLSDESIQAHYLAGAVEDEDDHGPVRVTRFFLESLQSGGPSAGRVTQFYAEALVSSRTSAEYLARATTGLRLGLAAAEVADFPAAAATGMRAGLAPSGRLLPVRHATTGLSVGEAGDGAFVSWHVDAATGLRAGVVDSLVYRPVKHATTGLLVGLAPREVARLNVHGATGVLSGLTAHTTRPWPVSATTGVRIGIVAPPFDPQEYELDATTGLLIGLTEVHRATARYHRIATSALLAGSVGSQATPSVSASAATGLRLIAQATPSGPTLVAASTGLAVGLDATEDVVTTTFFVAAATGLRLGLRALESQSFAIAVAAATSLEWTVAAPTGDARNFSVAAVTSLRVGSRGAETHRTGLAAVTGFLAATAPRKGREIHVTATTGLMASLADGNGTLLALASATGVRVGHAATTLVAGTEADTAFTLAHLATAEVWLPWRRDAPTLLPGGQLPH